MVLVCSEGWITTASPESSDILLPRLLPGRARISSISTTRRKTVRGSSEVRIIIYRRMVQDESGKLVMKSGRHAVHFVRVLNSITKCTHQIWCWELTKVLQGMLKSSLITFRWNLFLQDATFIYKIQLSECYQPLFVPFPYVTLMASTEVVFRNLYTWIFTSRK